MSYVNPSLLSGPHTVCPVCGAKWLAGDQTSSATNPTFLWVTCPYRKNGHPDIVRYPTGCLVMWTDNYMVVWDCQCHLAVCRGRNVIFCLKKVRTFLIFVEREQAEDKFMEHSLPFTATEKEVYAFVAKGTWTIR